MEDVIRIASYICQRYKETYGARISEMKLHKLLYFTQRECIVQTGEPLFEDKFEAWKYGPVLVTIRQHYKDDTLHESISAETLEKYQGVFDKVFETLASKDAWSLSTLTHGEYSWQKARTHYGADASCSIKIDTDDIRKDAARIRTRRFLLHHLNKV